MTATVYGVRTAGVRVADVRVTGPPDGIGREIATTPVARGGFATYGGRR